MQITKVLLFLLPFEGKIEFLADDNNLNMFACRWLLKTNITRYELIFVMH